MPEELTVIKQEQPLFLTPVMNVGLAKSRLVEFQEFISGYLVESKDGGNDGGDYGIIPGTKKKTLLKSGAEKLCEIYGLYDEYIIDSKIEDFASGLFYYQLTCVLKSKRDNSIVGTGMGSCSSYESKFRWRDSQRKCPKCDAAAIIKGKSEYVKKDGSGYWLCYAKKGGCGATFKQGDQDIEAQSMARIENPDLTDVFNTVLKVGKKRAKVDAVIGVTRSSGTFTQDVEDLVQNGPGSRQDAPGSNGDPFIEGKIVEEKQKEAEPEKQTPKKAKKDAKSVGYQEEQWPASYHLEIANKQQICNELFALPCFDIDRDNKAKNGLTMYETINRTDHTLEGITKILRILHDQAEIRAKAQKQADKEAGLEITEADLPLLNNIESATEVF